MTEQESWRAAAERARLSIRKQVPIEVVHSISEAVGGHVSECTTQIQVYPITPRYMLATYMCERGLMLSDVASGLGVTLHQVFGMLQGDLQFDFPLVEAALYAHQGTLSEAKVERDQCTTSP